MASKVSIVRNASISDKVDLSPSKARRFLEPGPVVLVTSCYQGRVNIMTLGRHTIMAFQPSLVGCVISNSNHSFQMILRSRECVINLPTARLVDLVVGVGNSTGSEIDKFSQFGFTAEPARKVQAPLIAECHANFECKLYDDAMVDKYNFFIFEIVKGYAARSPKHPETLHYTGDGTFVTCQKSMSRKSLFRPGVL